MLIFLVFRRKWWANWVMQMLIVRSQRRNEGEQRAVTVDLLETSPLVESSPLAPPVVTPFDPRISETPGTETTRPLYKARRVSEDVRESSAPNHHSSKPSTSTRFYNGEGIATQPTETDDQQMSSVDRLFEEDAGPVTGTPPPRYKEDWLQSNQEQ